MTLESQPLCKYKYTLTRKSCNNLNVPLDRLIGEGVLGLLLLRSRSPPTFIKVFGETDRIMRRPSLVVSDGPPGLRRNWVC